MSFSLQYIPVFLGLRSQNSTSIAVRYKLIRCMGQLRTCNQVFHVAGRSYVTEAKIVLTEFVIGLRLAKSDLLRNCVISCSEMKLIICRLTMIQNSRTWRTVKGYP